MAQDRPVSPSLSVIAGDGVESVQDNELTPSPTGLKGKQRSTKRRHSETSSSSKGSSNSSSLSYSDNSDSDEFASRKDSDCKRRKKRVSSPKRKATPAMVPRVQIHGEHESRNDNSPDQRLMFMCVLTRIAQPVKN